MGLLIEPLKNQARALEYAEKMSICVNCVYNRKEFCKKFKKNVVDIKLSQCSKSKKESTK